MPGLFALLFLNKGNDGFGILKLSVKKDAKKIQ